MKLKFLSAFFFLLAITTLVAMDDAPFSPVTSSAPLTSAELRDKTVAYVDFMKLVGRSNKEEEYSPQIPVMFSIDCTKVINNNIAYETLDGVLPQFIGVKEKVGTWTMEYLHIFTDPDQQASTVYLKWQSEKLEGPYVTIAILKFNLHGQITLIDEVFNKI